MTTKNSLTHSALLPIEHVAEVMPGHNLHWAGTGSIIPLCERTGAKVGSKLITIEQAQTYIACELEKIRNIATPETIPEGWKLVPVEPTPSMILNGWLINLNPKEAYADMLASAPQPNVSAQSNFTVPDVKTAKKTLPTDTEILDWLDRVSHKKANDWWIENFGTDYNHQSLREVITNAMRTE